MLDSSTHEVVEQVVEPWWTEAEYELLCKVVMAEVGSEKLEEHTCIDTLQQEVTQVIINRVNHPEFPSTIEEVLHQPNQYACIPYLEQFEAPTERVRGNVLKSLEASSTNPVLPADVVWQAEFTQSAWGTEVSVYREYTLGDTTVYLCHYGR